MPVSPFVFAGPSLSAIEATRSLNLEGLTLLPPAKRGDIAVLLAKQLPGTIVIVDGLFDQALSIGHIEIRNALFAGWKIWGLSSMGAIRAFEMRDCGMIGFGAVYNKFLEFDDFRDDEVALLHEPTIPYRAFTEPLIHMRYAIEHIRSSGHINRIIAELALNTMDRLWFGHRTIARLYDVISLLCNNLPIQEIEKWFGNWDAFRVKSLDLVQFVTERPWASQ